MTDKSRMFQSVRETWNPVTGCQHGCIYCWAEDLALGKLKNSPRYRDGFKPMIHVKELKKNFKPGGLVFVTSMGDLFGRWVPDTWIGDVFQVIDRNPVTQFLLQTKNPQRFVELADRIPQNCVLGATIETNEVPHVYRGDVPDPFDRYIAMRSPRLRGRPKFLSIEPVMRMDLYAMATWVREILPQIVEIGADNYGHSLLEPTLDEVETLISSIEAEGITVKRKPGLERLKETR